MFYFTVLLQAEAKLCRVRLEKADKFTRVGADKVVNQLAVLVEEECGDRADAELLSDFGNLIDVEFDKVNLVAKLFRVGMPDSRTWLVTRSEAQCLGMQRDRKLTFREWEQWPCKEGTSRRTNQQ